MNRISTRLAISFLIVALLPTLPLSLVVRDLLERRFGPGIAQPLESALESGLSESRAHLQERRRTLQARAALLAGADDLVLLDGAGGVQPADSLAALLAAQPELADQLAALRQAGGGDAGPQRVGGHLATAATGADGRARVVLQPLPAGMVARAHELTDGLSLLRLVRSEQSRVVLSFVAPFLVIYGLLILVALGTGLLWSRRMVRPLEALVSATRRVARGDLEFRVDTQGPGEVGELALSFDIMIGRLGEQRRDLARLERAAAWRGMARTLAHEVKNPLTPILLAVRQLKDNYRGDDPQYRALLDDCHEIVSEEVDKLRRLVREFGDFARMPKPELKPGDLVELLHDLGGLYGDRVAWSSDAAAVAGWFDAEALRRALVNLIDNGLAACREAGAPEQVALHLTALTPGARLTVRDAGAGIPPENLERIFEPDFTTKGDGMGLGLAIVQGCVVGHGGTLRVDSAPGAGTTFTIDLPLVAVGDDVAAAKEEER